MYCGQCGTQNNEEAGHCETCGAPLLITAGARSCATCGSSLGDHDRFCPTCGSPADDAIDASTYDASDHFGELNIGDIEISDLPDWLREMAPQPDASEPAGPAQSSANGLEQTPADDLPDWLRGTDFGEAASLGTSASHGPAEASGVDHQPAEQFSPVSDEDLPEWLRALGDGEPKKPPQPLTQPHQAASQPQPQQTSAVATLFDVPPINRAWQARDRQVDESRVSMAQAQFSPLEIVSGSVASAEAARTQIWDADSQQTEPFAVVEEGQESESGSAGGLLSTRGREIAVLALLVVLLLVMLVLAFILLQGMV